MIQLKVLITVKTYPQPSSKYDELVCTAGVTEDGDFIRLYPINFRDLPFDQQYRKYQWIALSATKHVGRDSRKESYRPVNETVRILGEPLGTDKGTWRTRATHVLKKKATSLEDLRAQQKENNTSLGIFQPRTVYDIVVSEEDSVWKPSMRKALLQARLWEDRRTSLTAPRKVPFKFKYKFDCSDPKCRGHNISIHDWELGRLYWRCVDDGATPVEAARSVKERFLDTLCADDRDTHFYVGTMLDYPTSWIILGVYWPRLEVESNQLTLRLPD